LAPTITKQNKAITPTDIGLWEFGKPTDDPSLNIINLGW
jgi:hypothetical protein